jgi:O-antigen/teichoic acid export membrane protein
MNDQAVFEPAASVATDTQFRSQVGHISRHSGALFAGTIFTAAIGYVFKVYLARVLGAEALGIYALGITLVGFLGTFNSLGLPESAVRFAAVYRANHKTEPLRALLFWGGGILLAANVVFALIFLAMGKVVARRFYHSPVLLHYLPWFAAIMLLGTISVFYGRILAGYKSVGRRTIITNFVGSPATMILAVLLISAGWGLTGYLLAQVLSAVLVIGLLLMVVWKLTPREARFLLPRPRSLERDVWSFSAAAVGVLLLEFLMGQVDKVALGFYLGPRSVGIYSVAAAVVAYETLVLNSVNQVFSPVIADLHSRGDNAMLGKLYQSLTKWMFAITLPLAITVIVDAGPLMRTFGHDFEAGWPILIIGTLGQLVNCAVGSVGLMLLMSGNQSRLLRAQAGMAVVMTVLSVVLIPIWGVVGAAIAAAITNAGTNLWNLASVRRIFRFSPFTAKFARLVPPGLGAIVIVVALRRAEHVFGHDWLLIGLSLIGAYGAFVGITALLGLDSDDRMVVGALWSKIWPAPASSKGIGP